MNRDLSFTSRGLRCREIEKHISDLGDLMLQSYADGDHKAAKQWLRLQEEAIASRTPGQVLKLEQEKGLV